MSPCILRKQLRLDILFRIVGVLWQFTRYDLEHVFEDEGCLADGL